VARKKKAAEHENHERWLVSYADFITLLFAFFVVMFATSQTDKAKAQQVSESVKEAIEKGGVAAAVHEILGGTVDEKGKGNGQMKGPGGAQKASKEASEARVGELLPSLQLLTKALDSEIRAGKIQIRMEPRGLVVSLRQATFFPSGEDTVDPTTYPSIEKIASLIQGLPNRVRLEGHTDSVPIHTTKFRSNWDLSAARAIATLDLLSSRFQIANARMAVAGYADTSPVASNDTAEGRAHNRRVDIIILSEKGIVSEPVPNKEAAPAANKEAAPAAAKEPAHKKE